MQSLQAGIMYIQKKSCPQMINGACGEVSAMKLLLIKESTKRYILGSARSDLSD